MKGLNTAMTEPLPSPLPDSPPDRSETAHRFLLLAVAAIVLGIWHVVPFGQELLYPFTLFSTWVHETGHGLVAIATGGEFHQLVINPDASGTATSTNPAGTQAAVSLGGLLAPPVTAAVMLAVGRTPNRSQFVLLGLTALMVLTLVLWVRGLTGWITLPVLAVGFGVIGWRGGRLALLGNQFVALLLVLLTVTRMDYLFAGTATVRGEKSTSDIATFADQVGGPYLMWGVVVAAVSIALCGFGLWRAWRRRVPATASG